MNQTECGNHTSEPEAKPFRGFKLPTSSTTYTPNQFFDVVLPNASRGCLRLVAFLIRKTLGWSDEHGNPVNEQTHVSYRELIDDAGISRGAIKDAIDEAIEKRYVECLRFGQPHRAGEEGYSALYSLHWDFREEYITSSQDFDGFYAGNGNLTHIPNDFFDFTIPNEPLAIVRVVGVIIRHTIGFQTRYGFRRQHVEMSFSEIMRRTGIASSSTVSNALKVAVERNYIRKVAEGIFDPSAGTMSKATTFAVCWDENPDFEPVKQNGSKIEAGEQFKNRSGVLETVQKSKRPIGSEIEAANGPFSEAVTVQKSKPEAFKNRSDIETTNLNDIPKQQQTGNAVVAGRGSLALLVGRLLSEGIDPKKAAQIVEDFPSERIERQLDCLHLRKVKSSKTGFLIRAIEQDIPAPSGPKSVDSSSQVLAAHFYAELGGNEGEPISVVSTADEEASTSLLSRFPAAAAVNAANLGREFARYVVKHSSNSKFPIRTLPLAIRSHGNEFLTSRRSRLETEQRERLAQARTTHEKELQPAYRNHLRSVAQQFERDGGEPWTKCEKWMESKLERRRRMSDTIYKRTLEQIATVEGRADFVLDYLAEANPNLIPTFWVWDATINEAPFSTEGTST